jgi:hypothetical protein
MHHSEKTENTFGESRKNYEWSTSDWHLKYHLAIIIIMGRMLEIIAGDVSPGTC